MNIIIRVKNKLTHIFAQLKNDIYSGNDYIVK